MTHPDLASRARSGNPASQQELGWNTAQAIGGVIGSKARYSVTRCRSGRSGCFHGVPEFGIGALGDARQGSKSV